MNHTNRRHKRKVSLFKALFRYRTSVDMSNMSDEQRRAYIKYRKRLKKRRVLFFRRVKFFFCVFLIFALIIFSIVKMVGCARKGKEKENDKNAVQVAQPVTAATVPEPTKPKITVQYPTKSDKFTTVTSENIRSEKVILVDVENNQVIAGKNWEGTIYPASMTKVMTLIIAVENLKSMDQTYTMTIDIVDPLVRENASRAGFDPGEVVNAMDMLYGLILPSGADAAIGLANMISGSEAEFVKLMNKKCEEMGLKSTHFVNTSGLHDANQFTTLTEMAMIMEYAMQEETCAKILSTYQYTTKPTSQHPEGILLTSTMFSRMYGDEPDGAVITAGKTGYVIEAGNCMVSYGNRGDRHFIVVTASGTNKWHSIFDAIELFGKYTNN